MSQPIKLKLIVTAKKEERNETKLKSSLFFYKY